MGEAAATAQLYLWLPTLVIANVFAAAFLVQTWLLASPAAKHALSRWLRAAARCGPDPLPLRVCAAAEAPRLRAGAPPAAAPNASLAAAAAAVKARAAERVLIVAGPCDDEEEGGAGPGRAPALRWEGVGVSCRGASGVKWVLKDAWGQAAAGEMQALLGPSGAGKSTLLEVLALRKRPSAGRVAAAAPGGRRGIAFVPQDDAFAPTLSAAEVLRFYESLLPPAGGAGGSRGAAARPAAAGPAGPAAAARGAARSRAREVLRVMGLEAARDTLVGGALPGGLSLRGLSGGERKRLAIACGILGRPGVLLLDEPTSGLDSCAAHSVVAHVRGMALEGGQAVVAAIHQPAAALWAVFDTVTLLANGWLLYSGPTPGLAPWLGGALGRPYDPSAHGLPSDFALELASAFGASGDFGTGAGGVTPEDLAGVAERFRRRQQEEGWGQRAASDEGGAPGGGSSSGSSSGGGSGSSGGGGSSSGLLSFAAASGCWGATAGPPAPAASAAVAAPARRSFGAQFATLLRRELLLTTRNPADVAGRTLTFVWVAALVGFCFYAVPDAASGVRARLNILFSSLCFLLLMPFLSTSLLAGGKEAFVRDAGARLYSPLAYYTAKVAASLPFGVFSAACFHLVQYGMTGLRHGAAAAARSCALGVLAYLVGAQVLHLAVLVTPHQDSAFMLAIGWMSLQMIFSGFFVGFQELRFSWLAKLRHVSAMYYALEGSAAVEFADRACGRPREPPSGLRCCQLAAAPEELFVGVMRGFAPAAAQRQKPQVQPPSPQKGTQCAFTNAS